MTKRISAVYLYFTYTHPSFSLQCQLVPCEHSQPGVAGEEIAGIVIDFDQLTRPNIQLLGAQVTAWLESMGSEMAGRGKRELAASRNSAI